eukprot:CAMPEP_0172472430 /NCGR_PEP_ID=MMETSP1065-20121228/68330_1 /TAXON_ID=265537 /ORGANISM="Amphiprora paludosa, Strain CCMP125" /LENGTH=754 /DNA_ID=CAMNT_0013230565 /DNA_START=293 /DNA_END=2558 /DNA_ORIENTATION=+
MAMIKVSLLERKLERLERMHNRSCNYERVVAATALWNEQQGVDGSTLLSNPATQHSLALRGASSTFGQKLRESCNSETCQTNHRRLLKRVRQCRASTKALRKLMSPLDTLETETKSGNESYKEAGEETSMFDGLKTILEEQKRQHSLKQKRLEEMRQVNAAAERTTNGGALALRRNSVHSARSGTLLDDMSAITAPSYFDASFFMSHFPIPVEEIIPALDDMSAITAPSYFDASIFHESFSNSSGGSNHDNANNTGNHENHIDQDRGNGSNSGIEGLQVEVTQTERRFSEIMEEIQLVGVDDSSDHSPIGAGIEDDESQQDHDTDREEMQSTQSDASLTDEDEDDEDSSHEVRLLKGTFDLKKEESVITAETTAETRHSIEQDDSSESVILKGKLGFRDDSLTEITLEPTTICSMEEEEMRMKDSIESLPAMDATNSSSNSESSRAEEKVVVTFAVIETSLEESATSSNNSCNSSSLYEDTSECRTTYEEALQEDHGIIKAIQEMKQQVRSLQNERNATEETARVFLNGFKSETARLEKENELLQDDRNTAYQELKNLLLQENLEAERLQERLSALKRSQSTLLKRCLATAALLLLVLAGGVMYHFHGDESFASVSSFLSAPSEIDWSWEGLCSPAKPGTRLVDNNSEDSLIGEAPWWVPPEYSQWKQPAYDILGCSGSASLPRTTIQVQQGHVWVRQASNGKLLLKKPSTTVYIGSGNDSGTLQIFDQRAGQHQQVQAPWATRTVAMTSKGKP